MKQILTVVVLLLISTWVSGQGNFSRVDTSTDSTYGYTDTNPIKMKKGNFEKSIGYSFDFLQGLKTIDNQKLQFLQRSTVDNPGYKKPDGGSLDKYTFLKSVEKDTVTIYIDLYNKGKLKIPMGLKYIAY